MPKKKNLETEIDRLLEDFSTEELIDALNSKRPKGKPGRPKISEENAIIILHGNRSYPGRYGHHRQRKLSWQTKFGSVSSVQP